MSSIKKSQAAMPAIVAKLRGDLRDAKKALKLAASIMEYCGGDKWERECTADDRKKFDQLYEKIM